MEGIRTRSSYLYLLGVTGCNLIIILRLLHIKLLSSRKRGSPSSLSHAHYTYFGNDKRSEYVQQVALLQYSPVAID